MLRRISNIALNPFSQALIVALAIIIFTPTGINKYMIEQAGFTTSFDKSQFVFADLDHDSYSERIQTFLNLPGNAGIALKKGEFTLGQWNFRGTFEPGSPRFMIGNYDHDQQDEIYLFTIDHDSIILQGLAFSQEPNLFIKDRHIAVIKKRFEEPDYLFIPRKVTDMTGDGNDDLVFAISGGHSRIPRNVFIYDIRNDSLLISPQSGAFISNIKVENLDSDPLPEILISTYASSNFNDEPVIYSDTSSWMMLLDHNLQFVFPPVEFPGPTGGLQMTTIETSTGEKRLLCCATYGIPVAHTRMWFLANTGGKILKEKKFSVHDPLYNIGFMIREHMHPADKGFCLNENDGFYEIDSNLEITKISDIKFSRWAPDFLDVDLDGIEEIIVLAPDHENHIICRNDFSNPVTLDFPVQSINPVFSIKLNGKYPPQLSVQGDQDWKLFNYGINPLWRFRFLIWLGIYLSILSFILIIRKLYSFQLKKRYETEKKIATLQLSSVKAQMEPHFIMNTINTIGSSIYRKKPDEAYHLLLNFSGMVRSLLVSSDKLTRSLKEELDFVRNYLELEKSRFAEVFSYAVNLADDVNPEALIPKMIIQLHAENALKHGLLPRKSGGFLDISVSREGEYLIITVTDNGIGRNMASENISHSTGKGMKILAQFFETYNKHNKIPLKQEIVDLYDDEKNPAGTVVKVFVPVDFNAGIF
jgi:two-component sensor histidine kinase